MLDVDNGPDTIANDSTPHASLGNHEADHAGAFFLSLKVHKLLSN